MSHLLEIFLFISMVDMNAVSGFENYLHSALSRID
jgi:hypothetical protein